MSSFEITFANLWTYEGGSEDRLPLNMLSENGGHIHGLLQVKVDGRPLPYLGYFGPDDVCFNEWAFELQSARASLKASTNATYAYDEGEQGQPAFLFEREGDVAFISIVTSKISDGAAHPDWQRVQFSFVDFDRHVTQFLRELHEHVLAQSPQYGRHWWARVVDRSA